MHEIKCFTPREQTQIVKQFQKGTSQTELAHLWGVSRSTIYRVLENHEAEPRKLSENDREILKVIRVRQLDRDSLVLALDKPALSVENIVKVLGTADDNQMLFILKQARVLRNKLRELQKGEADAAA